MTTRHTTSPISNNPDNKNHRIDRILQPEQLEQHKVCFTDAAVFASDVMATTTVKKTQLISSALQQNRAGQDRLWHRVATQTTRVRADTMQQRLKKATDKLAHDCEQFHQSGSTLSLVAIENHGQYIRCHATWLGDSPIIVRITHPRTQAHYAFYLSKPDNVSQDCLSMRQLRHFFTDGHYIYKRDSVGGLNMTQSLGDHHFYPGVGHSASTTYIDIPTAYQPQIIVTSDGEEHNLREYQCMTSLEADRLMAENDALMQRIIKPGEPPKDDVAIISINPCLLGSSQIIYAAVMDGHGRNLPSNGMQAQDYAASTLGALLAKPDCKPLDISDYRPLMHSDSNLYAAIKPLHGLHLPNVVSQLYWLIDAETTEEKNKHLAEIYRAVHPYQHLTRCRKLYALSQRANFFQRFQRLDCAYFSTPERRNRFRLLQSYYILLAIQSSDSRYLFAPHIILYNHMRSIQQFQLMSATMPIKKQWRFALTGAAKLLFNPAYHPRTCSYQLTSLSTVLSGLCYLFISRQKNNTVVVNANIAILMLTAGMSLFTRSQDTLIRTMWKL